MSTRLASLAALLSGLLAAACSPEPQAPAPIDLRAATGRADLTPTGVAVDPTGARYIFDEDSGLYRFDADGTLAMVMPREAMPDPGVQVRAPFTDLVAIGPERFAITAIGDGYLLDAALATMRPYFCYEPEELPDPYTQRTDAVTYDPATHLLYAQPRTFDGNVLVSSQVASYSEETGADLEWTTIGNDIVAGGMAKLPGQDGILLGVRTGLCNLVGTTFIETIDLAHLGIVNIDGLAVDAQANTLLVLDGEADQLLELDLDSLHSLAP